MRASLRNHNLFVSSGKAYWLCIRTKSSYVVDVYFVMPSYIGASTEMLEHLATIGR